VAIIVGLAELIKQTGLDKRWIPLFDLSLGIGIGIVIYGIAKGYGIIDGIVLGTALGLSACGLFSGIKNFIKQ
jgi:hypothetical protein